MVEIHRTAFGSFCFIKSSQEGHYIHFLLSFFYTIFVGRYKITFFIVKMESNQSQNKRIRREEDVTTNYNAIVELNIGGKVFATSRETLLNHGSSYFERLLESGELGGAVVRGALRDNDGRLFIDRNPDMFGPILEYMRSFKIPIQYKDLPSDNREKKALIEEARYYQLENLEMSRCFWWWL